LRALTADEAQDYRRVGLATPIAIVPSGIDVPLGVSPNSFLESYPQLAGKRIVLFLGRLHYKKGLHLLLPAWAQAARPEDAHLVIAGPDSGGTLASLNRMCGEFKLHSSVTFTGMLAGDMKWSTLAAASLFVLPSYQEGLSVAALEALGMKLPVLVTTACHLPEVASRNCGWVTETAVEPLRHALEEFFELSRDESAQAGQRGKDFVEQRFRWSVVGKQMAQVYEWLEGGGRPQGVEIV
jgi:glycosyltransferase involved in cell wall biosynthesis